MELRTNGFLLGKWTVFPLEGRLKNGDEVQRIQPKSMDVLVVLAEAKEAVVSRETLLNEVWQGRAVSDEPLTRCIGEIRRALGDTSKSSQYIHTVPKRGYQLLQKVIPLDVEEDTRENHHDPSEAGGSVNWRAISAIGIGLLTISTLLGLAFLNREDVAAFSPPDWSIVVLPFDDVSQDGAHGYMSDGVADEVTNLLSRVNGLRVTSRSSAVAVKRQGIDIPAIARKLNVAYVLEGSVRTSGDRIRISANLVDTRSDTRIWSEDFYRELKDVFAIQDEIARSVSDALKIVLTSSTPVSLQTDPAAYTLFLQARELHQQPAGSDYQRAFDLYEAALAIDPNYTPAWVWLAALYDDTQNSSDWSATEARNLARRAVDRALKISPEDPLALGMSSLLSLSENRDLARSASEMQTALKLEPNNPILMRWSVNILLALARFDEAVQVGEQLYDQDPVGTISRINLALTYVMAGEFEKAIPLCRIVISESDSGGGPCLSALVLGLAYSGRGEAAVDALLSSESSRLTARLSPRAFFAAGAIDKYEESLEALIARYEAGDRNLASAIARSYAFAGNDELAIAWLTKAVENGGTLIAPGLSYYRSLETNPQYLNLLEQTGNSAAQLESIEFVVRDRALDLID
ncbi:MAG: winged helix-turn-helix domain-containing protein [Pseudomonadota bacterium]